MALQLSTADVRERSFEAAEVIHATAIAPRRRQDAAKELANLAEYLAVELHGHPEQVAAAAEALDEWADGDPTVFALARDEVRGDTNLDALRTEALVLLQHQPIHPSGPGPDSAPPMAERFSATQSQPGGTSCT
jgi:hypothetical protein